MYIYIYIYVYIYIYIFCGSRHQDAIGRWSGRIHGVQRDETQDDGQPAAKERRRRLPQPRRFLSGNASPKRREAVECHHPDQPALAARARRRWFVGTRRGNAATCTMQSTARLLAMLSGPDARSHSREPLGSRRGTAGPGTGSGRRRRAGMQRREKRHAGNWVEARSQGKQAQRRATHCRDS